jgi:hypothetical protein
MQDFEITELLSDLAPNSVIRIKRATYISVLPGGHYSFQKGNDDAIYFNRLRGLVRYIVRGCIDFDGIDSQYNGSLDADTLLTSIVDSGWVVTMDSSSLTMFDSHETAPAILLTATSSDKEKHDTVHARGLTLNDAARQIHRGVRKCTAKQKAEEKAKTSKTEAAAIAATLRGGTVISVTPTSPGYTTMVTRDTSFQHNWSEFDIIDEAPVTTPLDTYATVFRPTDLRTNLTRSSELTVDASALRYYRDLAGARESAPLLRQDVEPLLADMFISAQPAPTVEEPAEQVIPDYNLTAARIERGEFNTDSERSPFDRIIPSQAPSTLSPRIRYDPVFGWCMERADGHSEQLDVPDDYFGTVGESGEGSDS